MRFCRRDAILKKLRQIERFGFLLEPQSTKCGSGNAATSESGRACRRGLHRYLWLPHLSHLRPPVQQHEFLVSTEGRLHGEKGGDLNRYISAAACTQVRFLPSAFSAACCSTGDSPSCRGPSFQALARSTFAAPVSIWHQPIRLSPTRRRCGSPRRTTAHPMAPIACWRNCFPPMGTMRPSPTPSC